MELNLRQLSTLQEMGISVWELRSDNVEIAPATNEIANAEPSQQLRKCRCIVVIEYQTNTQSQRLLVAMLFAIGITQQQTAIVRPDQLPQLQSLVLQNKVLLVLGVSLAQSLFNDDMARGEIHQTLPSKLASVVSFSLEELLNSPENKALAWQDLQLVKASLSQQ